MTMRMRHLALALLIAVGAPVGAHAAPAAPQTAAQNEARAHFKKGEADYAAGNYGDALTAYQAGYDAEPLPGFLVNIAQCQRRMGDLARARATYQKFIMVAPDSPLVPEVKKLVEDLDRLLAEAAAAEQAAPAAQASGVPGSNDPMELQMTSGDGTTAAPVSLAATAPVEEQQKHVGGPTPADAQSGSGRRWWLWGGAAAVVVVGAATTAFLLSRGDGATTIHEGSLGTVRR